MGNQRGTSIPPIQASNQGELTCGRAARRFGFSVLTDGEFDPASQKCFCGKPRVN